MVYPENISMLKISISSVFVVQELPSLFCSGNAEPNYQ